MHKTGHNYIELSERIIERINQAILSIKAAYGERLLEVCLIGSYAKGEQNKYSSIDLLVIIEDSDVRFIKRKADLERLLNEDDELPLIDPLVYTEAEVMDLVKKMESFMVSVLNESVVIWNGFNEIDMQNLKHATIIPSRYKAATPNLEEI